jgi:hypothetical protein
MDVWEAEHAPEPGEASDLEITQAERFESYKQCFAKRLGSGKPSQSEREEAEAQWRDTRYQRWHEARRQDNFDSAYQDAAPGLRLALLRLALASSLLQPRLAEDAPTGSADLPCDAVGLVGAAVEGALRFCGRLIGHTHDDRPGMMSSNKVPPIARRIFAPLIHAFRPGELRPVQPRQSADRVGGRRCDRAGLGRGYWRESADVCRAH